MTMLEVALEHAARGWCVFPCKADKTPMTKHGFLDATTEEAKLHEWWGKRPAALVGIATGGSELVVIDLDVKNDVDGLEEWAALCRAHGKEIENTTLVETPSGGMHVYYRANGHKVANSASRLAPGVDVRAEGGYVIGAGSPGYEYVEGHGAETLSELPAALAEKLAYARTNTNPPLIPPEALVVPAGARNATLTSLGGRLRNTGMGASAIAAALRAHNKEHCKPPLSAKEVDGIAESVERYTPRSPVAVCAPPGGAVGVHIESTEDTGNANRFIRLYGERVRWCEMRNCWYVYDGMRWHPDEVLEVSDMMKEALRGLFDESFREPDEKTRKELGKWAVDSMNMRRREAALKAARSDRRISVHPRDFDVNGFLVNTLSGTYDPVNDVMLPHSPADLLTKVTGAAYLPGAGSDLWERVVSEALGGDEEYIAGFQRACGYSLTASTKEELFFIMKGPTQSVKSTICDALRVALGNYCSVTKDDTWLEHQGSGGTRGDLVDLDGVRMTITAEMSKKATMATALIKQFVGGDPVVADKKYQHQQTMIPTAKIWIHTNEVPTMADDDAAIWRRAVVFPFEHPPATPDPTIKQRLKTDQEQKEAVLAWVLDGTRKYLREVCLKVPGAARYETVLLRLEMDPLQDWWSERCRTHADAWTSSATVRDSYQEWCKENGMRYPISPKGLANRLKDRGLKPVQQGGRRGWSGVEIVPAADDIGLAR